MNDNEEPCVRKRVEIGGENYYLMVGRTFVDITTPHENRPENITTRVILDTLCSEITNILRAI